MYTAVVLTPDSHNKLIESLRDVIPPTWEKIAHHMTVNMGSFVSGPASHDFHLGQNYELKVVSLAYDDKVMAVGVNCVVPSSNTVKHITIAVNRQGGGKPFLSNKLTNWQQTTPIDLIGILEEVS